MTPTSSSIVSRYGPENAKVLAQAYAETLTIVSTPYRRDLPRTIRLTLVEAMLVEARHNGFDVDRLTLAALAAMPEADWTDGLVEPVDLELVRQDKPYSFGWARSVGADRPGIVAWERPDGSICGILDDDAKSV